MLLKTSVLLLAPALFAYGNDGDAAKSSSPIAIGAEVQGHLVNVSWHTKAASTADHLDKLTSALTNAGGFAYQEANDKLPNYTFGGRVTAKSNFSDDFSVMLAFGIETGMNDGKGYRPLNSGAGTAAVSTDDITQANWNLLDTTGVSTWKNNMVMAPALFVGYGSVALGVEYDMREYKVSGHETALTTYLDKTIKDNQVLFGFRGEQSYDMDDMKLCLSVEFMTNLGTKADTDTDQYFKDLFKYGTDTKLPDAAIFSDGVMPATVSTYAAPSTRAVVSSVHTNVTKASVGIGVLFAEF